MANFQILLLTFASLYLVNGHMMLLSPAPLRAKSNPHSIQANIDYSYTAPLSSPAQYPGKGYLSDMSDPTGAGASVQSYTAGASASWSVTGGAVHGGGSCQIALGYASDNYQKLTVIHSYEGSCPLSDGQKFDFTVPVDAPTGPAIFSWTWFNKVGNREMYNNVASVKILPGSGQRAAPAVPFSQRPEAFIANLGYCTTIEGTEVMFPNPGPDVTHVASGNMVDTIKGQCLPVNGRGGNSGSSQAPAGTSSAASSSQPTTTSAAVPTTFATSASITIIPVTTAAPSSTSTFVPLSTGTPASGNLTISVDGTCGGNTMCRSGFCCSSSNFCGNSPQHCGAGCQSAFGQCGSSGSASNLTSRAFGRGVAGRVRVL